jgi:hypothetical protein
MVYPNEKLSIFDALSTFRIKRSPQKIPCASTSKVVLRNPRQKSDLCFENIRHLRSIAPSNELEKIAQRYFKLCSELVLVGIVESLRWLRVEF